MPMHRTGQTPTAANTPMLIARSAGRAQTFSTPPEPVPESAGSGFESLAAHPSFVCLTWAFSVIRRSSGIACVHVCPMFARLSRSW